MTYEQARQRIRTGDVALVKGLLSLRVLTGESYSHVALFVWMPGGGLWVFEFVEGQGFQSMPASQWVEKRRGKILYWGEAPPRVRLKERQVHRAAVGYREGRSIKRWYGWLSLPTIWISQLSGLRLPVWMKVCSTYVQEVWEAADFNIKRTADPGDIAEHCTALHRISWED